MNSNASEEVSYVKIFITLFFKTSPHEEIYIADPPRSSCASRTNGVQERLHLYLQLFLSGRRTNRERNGHTHQRFQLKIAGKGILLGLGRNVY